MNGRNASTWVWTRDPRPAGQTLTQRIWTRARQLAKLKTTVALASIAVASIAGVSWSAILTVRNHGYLEQTRYAVNETFEVKLLINDVIGLVSDIETGSRGFALTGDAVFAQPLEQAEARILPTLVHLSAAVSADPIQAQRVELITQLSYQRINHAHALIELVQQGANTTRLNDHARGGKILTDRIRELSADTWAMEAAHFTQRSTQLTEAMASARSFTWLLIGAEIALLVALGILALRWRRAQALVKVCAWSRTIEYEGEWITFEEYLSRRFGLLTSHGINPEEAEKLLANMDRS